MFCKVREGRGGVERVGTFKKSVVTERGEVGRKWHF